MKEFLFLSMFAVLVLVLIFALICSAINNISAFWVRTKEARKRKREQNEFQKAKAEITKQTRQIPVIWYLMILCNKKSPFRIEKGFFG